MRWRPLWGINMRGLQRRQIFHNSFICREPLQSVGNHREDCKGKSGSFCLAANNTQTQKHVEEKGIADHSIRWRLARNIEGKQRIILLVSEKCLKTKKVELVAKWK